MKLEPMRTVIRIQYKEIVKEKGSLNQEVKWIDIGNKLESDTPKYRHCSWKNLFGSELIQDKTIMNKAPAKVRMRCDPRINTTCRIIKEGEEIPYEIITSPDNVDDCNQIMEFRVQRMVGG